MVNTRHITQALFLVIAYVLSSCGSTKNLSMNKLAGNYSYNTDEGNTLMVLRPDSTFTYSWNLGYQQGQTEGKWKLDGANIILRSNRQPNDPAPDSLVATQIDFANKGATVKVTDKEGKPLKNAVVIAVKERKQQAEMTPDNGTVQLGFLPDTLKLTHAEYQPLIYWPAPGPRNYIQIKMLSNDEPLVYFVDERWQILSRKKLVPEGFAESEAQAGKFFRRTK